MNGGLIAEALRYAEELFRGNSDGHDFAHTMRVYGNAMKILEGEEADGMIVALGAILHDADDHKLFDTENFGNARSFLSSHGVDGKDIDRICEVIGSVSYSKNKGITPSTIEGRIVQDADRLDAMGAIGIARTFAYGGRCGRPLSSSIEHFHDKLLLLKDELNTGTARKMARSRHDVMVNFLKELKEETSDMI